MLSGKVAIVTGAARGIGQAIADKFAANGAKVYAVDVLGDALTWTKSARDVTPVPLDICDFTAVKALILQIKKEQGRLDVLVNNAGLISYELMSMIDFDRFRKMMDVNVIALVNLMQLAARVMQRQKSGSIINMASMVGLKGAKGQLSYSATKGAVIAVTKSAAKELAEYSIRVNAIAPGMVGTDRFKVVLSEKFSDKINDVPFARLATPDDIANAAVYFASDASSYITGQVLGIDGGMIL